MQTVSLGGHLHEIKVYVLGKIRNYVISLSSPELPQVVVKVYKISLFLSSFARMQSVPHGKWMLCVHAIRN